MLSYGQEEEFFFSCLDRYFKLFLRSLGIGKKVFGGVDRNREGVGHQV